jgi:hypothetical protein
MNRVQSFKRIGEAAKEHWEVLDDQAVWNDARDARIAQKRTICAGVREPLLTLRVALSWSRRGLSA